MPAHSPPLPEVDMLALVESQITVPSTVIFTLIVLAVASLVLNVKCNSCAPTPLIESKVFNVLAVIAPLSVAMHGAWVTILALAHDV
jgi:hypothetical protein